MKSFIGLTLFIILAIGCTKERSLSAAFAGTWEKESFTGFPGRIEYPSGNGQLLILTKNHFEIRNHATTIQSGSYGLESRVDCIGSVKELFLLTLPESELSRNKISIQDSKLVIASSSCVADGGVTTYRRVGE